MSAVNSRTFRVMLRGANFLVDSEGSRKKLGFFTSRVVQTSNPVDAENLGVQKLRETTDLKLIVRNAQHDPPRVFVEDIIEVEATEFQKPHIGLVWFPESQGQT